MSVLDVLDHASNHLLTNATVLCFAEGNLEKEEVREGGRREGGREEGKTPWRWGPMAQNSLSKCECPTCTVKQQTCSSLECPALCFLCARKARSTWYNKDLHKSLLSLACLSSVCRPPPGGQLYIDRCWCGGLAERGAGCGFIPEGESAASPRQLQCHTSDLEPPGHKFCHQRGLPGMEMRDNRSSMRPRQRYMYRVGTWLCSRWEEWCRVCKNSLPPVRI